MKGSKKAQWVKEPVAKPEDVRSIPNFYVVKREPAPVSASDLYMTTQCSMCANSPPPGPPPEFVVTKIHFFFFLGIFPCTSC